MDAPALLSFPLPLLTSLLCCVIAVVVWRADLGVPRASRMLSLVFVLGAVQSFLVALRFGYGRADLALLQGLMPLFMGPLIYLGFRALTIEGRPFLARLAGHLGAPLAFIAIFGLFVRDLRPLDWAISASYLFYLVALARLWLRGPDGLIHARVDLSRGLCNWILFAVSALAFILILDTIIALDFARNAGGNAMRLISYGTFPMIAILFAILMSLQHLAARSTRQRQDNTGPVDVEKDALMARIVQVMRDDELYLDASLSVERLAKRLHVPARSVSAVINQSQGMNVSQFVNEFRVSHAAELLVSGQTSVKDIAEASGFLARSNFYREFQRVYGMSPTEYRKSQADNSP